MHQYGSRMNAHRTAWRVLENFRSCSASTIAAHVGNLCAPIALITYFIYLNRMASIHRGHVMHALLKLPMRVNSGSRQTPVASLSARLPELVYQWMKG